MPQTTPAFANPNFDTMYPSRLVNNISSADWVTRPQTMPIAIARSRFIREYHIRGQYQNPNLSAIAQQALQLMGSLPQEEDLSTENEATIEMASQNEQQDVDNGNLSASNQDQNNLGITDIPCKRQLNEDEAEQYLCERIKRMRLDVDVLGHSYFGINGDRIIMEPSQAQLSTTNQQASEIQSTPTDTTKPGQNIYLGVDLNDPKAVWERLNWLKRNDRLQEYFEEQSNPTRTESNQRFENWLDSLSTPIEAAIECVIEEAIQDAVETATDLPIETPQIVHTIAQGRLFGDYRAEDNHDHPGDDEDQENIDSISVRIGLSEAASQNGNDSQDEDSDQQSDNHNDHDDDKRQEGNNSKADSNSEEDDESQEDDNVSDQDVDEQDTESVNSEKSDDAINEEAGLGSVIRALRATLDNESREEDNILEDSDLDVDEDDPEPMNPDDIEGAINEVDGYAVVYPADHQEPAQNELQRRIRAPLGELTSQELQQRNNRQQVLEEAQPEDPNATAVRTQRIRLFIRRSVYRSEEAPANEEEEEEMEDAMRDFQVQQLVEEAEPQPLRRSERIRRQQQEQQDDEEFENRPLPPHAGPQNPYQMEIDGQEFDHERGTWVFNGTFESMNWNFMSDVMRW
jgi:hypothetical protein